MGISFARQRLLAFIAVLALGCGSRSPHQAGQPSPPVGASTAALTAAQCDYFDVNGKTRIATRPARLPTPTWSSTSAIRGASMGTPSTWGTTSRSGIPPVRAAAPSCGRSMGYHAAVLP